MAASRAVPTAPSPVLAEFCRFSPSKLSVSQQLPPVSLSLQQSSWRQEAAGLTFSSCMSSQLSVCSRTSGSIFGGKLACVASSGLEVSAKGRRRVPAATWQCPGPVGRAAGGREGHLAATPGWQPPRGRAWGPHLDSRAACWGRCAAKEGVQGGRTSVGRAPRAERTGSPAERNGHSSEELPPQVAKETHKYFDQVIITVLKMARTTNPGKAPGKKARALQKAKQRAERGGLKKGSDGTVILPMGGHGGDVVLYADEFSDTLLELHKRKRYAAKRGNNANAVDGLSRRVADGVSAPQLRIPVPVGTVVKRKRGGKFLADLTFPGDELVVARGGRGGISMMAVPQNNQSALKPVKVPEGATVMNSPDDKALTHGLPGEELALELTLRVVADVGLVGFPNAGKSSLLAAATAARPAIAAYPFTTLMPNLGRLEGDPMAEDAQGAMPTTLADLPGLIEGAHLGRGLGRMFLRHLRRTRVLLHLVDASAEDPIRDYRCLREELWMYNEEYTERPHIVVLNKLDIPQAAERFETLKAEILAGKMVLGDGVEGEVESQVEGRSGSLEGATKDEGRVATRLVREEEEEVQGKEGEQRMVARSEGGGVEEEEKEEEEVGDEEVGLIGEEEEEIEANNSLARLRGKGTSRGANRMEGESVARLPVKEEEEKDEKNSRQEALAPPVAVVGISAKEGVGIEELLRVIRATLAEEDKRAKHRKMPSTRPRAQRLTRPQWQL